MGPQSPVPGREPARGALAKAATGLALFAAAISAAFVIGWLVDAHWVQAAWIGTSTTKLPSAGALLLASLSVLVHLWSHRRIPGILLAAVPAGIGVATVAYWAYVDVARGLGALDDASEVVNSVAGGIPGLNSGIVFLLLGLGLILVFSGRPASAGQILLLVAVLIVYLALVGHIMLVDVLHPDTPWTQMAITTAVPALAIATAGLLIRPHTGVMSVLTSPHLGAWVGRVLGAALVLVGLVMAFLVRALYYTGAPTPIPAQIVVVLSVPLTMGTLLFVAARLNRVDSERTLAHTVNTAVGSSIQGVVLVDSDGRIRLANAAASRMMGLDPDELVGRSIDDFVPEPDRPQHSASRRDFIAAGRNRTMDDGRQPILVDAAGREREVDIDLTILRQPGQEPVVLAMIRDASRLAAANRELERFAYVASHDLRAPLRSIRGFSEILRDTLPPDSLDEFTSDALDEILAGVGRMDDLIGALLDYSRIREVGDGATDVGVRGLVEGVLTELREPLADAGGQCYVDVPSELVWLVQEPLARSAVRNLLANSIKYREPARELRIEVGAERLSRWIALTVTDNGTGIPPEQLPRATQMFQRLTTSQEGQGIGLASARRIAESHGGHLALDSDGETFTRARLTLPAAGSAGSLIVPRPERRSGGPDGH